MTESESTDEVYLTELYDEPMPITDASLRLLDALDYEWWWEHSRDQWFLRISGPEGRKRMLLGPYAEKVGS